MRRYLREFKIIGNKILVEVDNKIVLLDLREIKYTGKLIHLDKYGYAFYSSKGSHIFIHRELMGKKRGYQIDHINRNKLDNRRKNLRFVRPIQNWRNNNAKGYYRIKNGRFRAYIFMKYKRIHLGYFATEEEAKEARQRGKDLFWGKDLLRT